MKPGPGPRTRPPGIVPAMGHQFGSMSDRMRNLRGECVSNAHMRDAPHPGWTVIEDNSMRCRCGVHFEDHQKRLEECEEPVEHKGNPKPRV